MSRIQPLTQLECDICGHRVEMSQFSSVPKGWGELIAKMSHPPHSADEHIKDICPTCYGRVLDVVYRIKHSKGRMQ